MERYDVAASVVSAAAGVYFGDQQEANELARMVNEAGAELVRSDPTRYAALAALPLPDVGAALDELEYALDILGLDGVVLLTSVDGTHVGEARFAPLLDELDRRAAYVLVHPAVPPSLPAYEYPLWVLELPFETTRAALSLLYSGTLARCPNLKIQLGHLGGAVPFLAGRMASLIGRDERLRDRVPEGPLAYIARFFYDTALSLNTPALTSTLEVASIDRVVFGTDWPYLPEPALDLEGAEAVLGGRSAVEQVAFGNAAQLVSRLCA